MNVSAQIQRPTAMPTASDCYTALFIKYIQPFSNPTTVFRLCTWELWYRRSWESEVFGENLCRRKKEATLILFYSKSYLRFQVFLSAIQICKHYHKPGFTPFYGFGQRNVNACTAPFKWSKYHHRYCLCLFKCAMLVKNVFLISVFWLVAVVVI